jgi:hypothetical protein
MGSFAEENGASFWNFDPQLHLDAEDFQDSVHLGNEEKRERFEKLFLRRLGRHLKKFYPPPGGGRGSSDDEGDGRGQ